MSGEFRENKSCNFFVLGASVAAMAIVTGVDLRSQSQAPGSNAALRRVEGRTLISASTPRATIEVAPGFRYAGGQQFVLYGVARAEQHFFVDAAADGDIRRLYWLQFEGYLPDNDRQYRYSSTDRRRIGPLEFLVDVLTQPPGASVRPDSDSAHAREYLLRQGLTFPPRAATVRYVHLVDAAKRSELMIIYRERLDETMPSADSPDSVVARGISGLTIK